MRQWQLTHSGQEPVLNRTSLQHIQKDIEKQETQLFQGKAIHIHTKYSGLTGDSF